MDSDSPPAPELPIKREASGRVSRDAPRRKAKTVPPPPPGSPERKALEDKIAELKLFEASEPAEPPAGASPTVRPPGPPPVPRPRTSQVPTARSRDGAVPDLSTVPEADKTKENRGAVGIGHDNSGSLTANAASGTIGGDTPAPLFDRAAIAAGPKGQPRPPGQPGALPAEWVGPGSGPSSANRGGLAATGTGSLATARGTPKPSSMSDEPPLRVEPAATAAPDPAPVRAPPDPAPVRAPPAPAPRPNGPADNDSERAVAELGSPAAGSRLTVPVGEFDEGQTVLEQDKLRIAHAQATIKRDAASALLGLAEPSLTVVRPPPVDVLLQETAEHVRGDVTFNDTSASSTGRFERADPTLGDERGDTTAISPSAAGRTSGTLRSSAALPRERGLAGDIRYVATAIFGIRAANRELAALELRQATRQQSRRHHLVTLGRAAVTSEGFDHPALGPSREQLAVVEDERSQHAGHVVAADAELTRVRRDREAKAKQYIVDLAALDSELATFAKRLEPLEKEAAGIKKRASDLHESLRRIDAKLAATEASLTSVKGGKLDRAGIQAELATLKADRRAIQSDEPVIAGQLDAINPRIAAIEAARTDAQRKRAELERAEQEDQRRVEELLAAIGAKRKVVDRAAGDAEVLRDKILFQLGERLYVDRPDDLTGQLAPIDEIDVELGVADRRTMELREIVSSVDRFKIARGVALIAVILGALGAAIGWLVYYLA